MYCTTVCYINDMQAVSIAAKAGHIEIVKLLIEQNADLNIVRFLIICLELIF